MPALKVWDGTAWQYAAAAPPATVVESVAVPATAGNTSGTVASRINGVVTVNINVTATSGIAGNTAIATVPLGYRPSQRCYFVGLDFNSGSQVIVYIDSSGQIGFTFARTSGQVTVGVCTYLAA